MYLFAVILCNNDAIKEGIISLRSTVNINAKKKRMQINDSDNMHMSTWLLLAYYGPARP